jgi:hypothetical protein
MATVSIEVYYPIIFIISTLMVLFVVLTYFASRVFRVTELEAYLNIELSEIFISLLIMFFAISLFLVSDGVAIAIAQEYMPAAPGAKVTAISAAGRVIEGTVLDVQEGVGDIFSLQVCLSILNTLQRRIGEFVLTVTYKLFPGIDSVIGITNVIGYALIGVLSSLTTQLFILNVVQATMGTFFLPAGIVLRFFPPTREAGVFLIALAIGFQSIFPLVYVINQRVGNDLANQGFEVFKGFKSPGLYTAGLCGGKEVAAGSLLFQANKLLPASPLLSALKIVFSEYSLNVIGTMKLFLPVLQSMAYLSLPALFLPALATTITFAFINALTKFMLTKM